MLNGLNNFLPKLKEAISPSKIKLGKKQLLIYGGLILLSVVLFPIFPLIWGVHFAIKLFRKRKIAFGIGTILVSLILSGFVTSKLPTSSQQKEKQTSTSPSETARPTESPASTTEATEKPSSTSQTSNRIKATVVKVVDGDTMDFSFNGKTERIRVIGINTPETVDPRKSVECFGIEASNKAKEVLKVGSQVELEADPTQGDRDKYDRLLRYVWINGASTDFGFQMISEGYAYEYTYDTPYKYQTAYKQAQKDAEAAKKGLWADNACTATPTPTPTATSKTSGTYSGSYSCTGPDLDCSDFSTHAEAQAFFDSCGFTATYDPMKLDSVGVGNGIACESLP